MSLVTAAAAAKAASARNHPKLDARSAWSSWQAGDDDTADADFVDRVSAWLEGTAFQLLRQKWPAGTARPTALEVQERLRRALAVVATGPTVAHVDAMALARQAVLGQLRRIGGNHLR